MKKRSDFQGLELDWFAVDSEGFVALMSSAGSGPIPDAVFERFDGQRHIDEFLGKLIGSCISDDLRRIEQLLASAGVFCYDWRHSAGSYQRAMQPPHPRRLDEFSIPANLREAFVTVPARFSVSPELCPGGGLPCATWSGQR